MKVGIIDILGKSVSTKAYSRFTRANNTSIMPQVVGAWCEELGHDTSIAYYSGPEVMAGGLPDDVQVVFINAFSQTALVAYALSNQYRAKGAITVLGGPHARSYPDHSARFFDYVIGFCDQQTLGDLLEDITPQRPRGLFISAAKQPAHLPPLEQRWKFLKPALDEAKLMKMVPMLGSLGCPYTCSFCVDAVVPYQPLSYEILKNDLRFLQAQKLPRSIVVWHDPNFGIRFNDYMGAIEEAVRPGSMTFLAESSLSLLSEENAKRLQRNGFRAILPGIESWFDIGDKSRMRKTHGMEKVKRISEHVNMIQQYIPYVQTNLILGLDADEGPEPFELTKQFIDLTPGAFPHYSLLTAYGRSTMLNLEFQKQNRVIPVPFHFLNQFHAMNVKPKNYGWIEYYDLLIDLLQYSFSNKALARRFFSTSHNGARFEQLFRGISSERNHRVAYHSKMRKWLQEPDMRAFFERETDQIPARFISTIRRNLGPLWEWLPEGAIQHDPNAFLNSTTEAHHPLEVVLA